MYGFGSFNSTIFAFNQHFVWLIVASSARMMHLRSNSVDQMLSFAPLFASPSSASLRRQHAIKFRLSIPFIDPLFALQHSLYCTVNVLFIHLLRIDCCARARNSLHLKRILNR
eukprot:876769_1